MPSRNRPRKRGGANAPQNPSATSISATRLPAAGPPQETPARGRRLARFLRSLDTGFRNVWFYVAAFALVVTIARNFQPALQMQASTVSKTDPGASLFTFVNAGPWTLSDIEITCVVSIKHGSTIILKNNVMISGEGTPPYGNGTIQQLNKNATATRDCGISQSQHFIRLGSSDPADLRINVQDKYRWFWGLFTGEDSKHFNTRVVGQNEYILVPDTE